jgi:hypothetical protein
VTKSIYHAINAGRFSPSIRTWFHFFASSVLKKKNKLGKFSTNAEKGGRHERPNHQKELVPSSQGIWTE